MDNRYSSFNISRKQAQKLCFAFLADIEAYVDEHQAEFEQFLLEEERKGGTLEKHDCKVA